MRSMQWIAEFSRSRYRFALLGIATVPIMSLVGCVSITGEDSTRRTPGGWIDDEVIERIAARQIDAADERLAISRVNIVSYDGIVLLTGQVENQGLRDLAEQSIRNIRKIRKIHNEIQIGGAIGIVARGADNWIQTKINTLFFAHEDIDASRIKVVAEDDTVYLIGMVPRVQADAAVAVARSVFGVKRVVKVFEYVDNGIGGS